MTTSLDEITNSLNTGIFDVLMLAVNTHIENQYMNNRITGADYANVYLGSIQAVLQQSVQYNLQKQLTEVQIDDALKGIELKTEQTKGLYAERIIKDKQAAKLGLDNVMKNLEGARLTSPSFVYTPNYNYVKEIQ